MTSLDADHPRRKFIRGLAAGSVAVASTAVSSTALVGSANAASSTSGGWRPEQATEPNLDDLQRWVAAGMDWQSLRKQFLLDPQVVHLNTGSLGACPRVVVDAHTHYLHEVERNPVHLLFGSMGEKMETVRKLAADFVGADLDEVMLTANTTSGMNLVADALPLQAGDEVLTSDEEHPGGMVCWEHERRSRGIVIRKMNLSRVAESAAAVTNAIEAAITERTKVISLSHVSTVSGLRMPVSAISRLARERGIFMVIDGAQSAGMMDIDVHEMGCDAFATSGHKWLLAPKGSGILYLRNDLQPRLSSVHLTGGLRAYTAASGTRNVPQILAQGTAMDFLNTIGRQRIEQRALMLARLLRQQLLAQPGVEVISPPDPELQSAIVTFKLPVDTSSKTKSAAWTGAAVSQKLIERQCVVVKAVPGEHLQGRGIRVSTHFYNTERDIEQMIQGLQEILTTQK